MSASDQGYHDTLEILWIFTKIQNSYPGTKYLSFSDAQSQNMFLIIKMLSGIQILFMHNGIKGNFYNVIAWS